MPIRKSLLPNFVLLALSLSLALGLLEVVVRLVDPPFFTGLQRYHPALGWLVEPGTVHYPERGGRRIRVEYNALGFRDVDHVPTKDPSVRRIVVLGDSFTEAAQVELQETYWSVLKRLLNRPGAAEYWEVVSLGVGAYGTAQELIALETYGLDYAPDLVILQVFPFNDVVNNSLAGAYVANPHDTYRPYLDPQTDYRTVTYLAPGTNWIRRRSALARQLFLIANRYLGTWGGEAYFADDAERLQRIAERLPIEGLRAELPPRAIRTAHLLNSLAPPAQQSEIVRQGWAATDQAIRRIHQVTIAAGAELMVLVIPHVRLFDGTLDGLRGQVPYPVDARYPEQRIAGLLAGSGVPVIPLAEVFENRLDVVLPIPAGHLNAATHQLIAELMLPQVEALTSESSP